MTKIITKKILLAISLFFIIFSCSKEQINPAIKISKKEEINTLPSWVLNPDVENGVGEVGIASPSKGGMKFQIRRALMDGRANIATKIQSEISRVTKEALRESLVNEVNDVQQVFTQATKEVVKNIPLSGVGQINRYVSEDGTLYVHVVLKNEDYSQYLANSQKIYQDRLKSSSIASNNLNESQEAVKEMFEELEKERK
jgi:hypothetical protein